MTRLFNLFVVALILVLLTAYMFTYTVRFDEVAVKTRFNKVNEADVEPGLHFKWPTPIEGVRRYPRNIQHLEDLLQEQQTADGIAIVIKLAADWRISDAEAFYTNVRTIGDAEDELRKHMAQLRELVSSYKFSDLVNADPDAVKLAQLEEEMTARLVALTSSAETNYGIEIERVAVVRQLLPESATSSVYNSMKAQREALAADARAAGEAAANAIRSDATTASERILSFARTAASRIEDRGYIQAAELLEVFDQNPGFAIFLQKIDGLREMLRNRPTIVLPTSGVGFDDVLRAANPDEVDE